MTATISRSSIVLPLIAVLMLSVLPSPRAQAGDLGKVLGALAAGYVAYQVLDNLSDNQRGQRYCAPPPPICAPAPAYPFRNYNPPPPFVAGGRATATYNNGYADGFKDGTNFGVAKGYQVGVRDGYRIGYGDGYGNGHRDGFIQGVHRR